MITDLVTKDPTYEFVEYDQSMGLSSEIFEIEAIDFFFFFPLVDQLVAIDFVII